MAKRAPCPLLRDVIDQHQRALAAKGRSPKYLRDFGRSTGYFLSFLVDTQRISLEEEPTVAALSSANLYAFCGWLQEERFGPDWCAETLSRRIRAVQAFARFSADQGYIDADLVTELQWRAVPAQRDGSFDEDARKPGPRSRQVTTTTPAPPGTRLELLKAAAAFLTSDPDADASDVLAVAQRWERWVTEGETDRFGELPGVVELLR